MLKIQKKRYNATITEYLKDFTGFKLRHDKISPYSMVQVDIVTTIPPDLLSLLENISELEIELILELDSLKRSINTFEFIEINYLEICELLRTRFRIPDIAAISSTHQFVADIIAYIQSSELYKKLNLLGLDNLLGAYFFRAGRIELYWPALAFYSAWKGLPLNDLTLVVLAHEKAHAITHLGFDLDGVNWNTNSFADSDLHIVEGLAQFYTEKVCAGMNIGFNLLNTYVKLRDAQSSPYSSYSSWLASDKSRDEKIRLTMLNTRKANIIKYDDFLKELKTSSANIKIK